MDSGLANTVDTGGGVRYTNARSGTVAEWPLAGTCGPPPATHGVADSLSCRQAPGLPGSSGFAVLGSDWNDGPAR
jgi:hypothetical protein